MKNIPNIITILRILLSVILFFLKPFSTLFWIVYSACGASDILDGYIARKTNSESNFGAILDTISDIVFIVAAVFILLPKVLITKGILIWIALIFFIRAISIFTAYIKYHDFVILHTYSNKLTGFLLFSFPYSYNLINKNIAEIIICIIASVSAAEELLIHIKSKELSRDIKGLFFINK